MNLKLEIRDGAQREAARRHTSDYLADLGVWNSAQRHLTNANISCLNFFVSRPKFTQSLVERGRDFSWQCRFPLVVIFISSGYYFTVWQGVPQRGAWKQTVSKLGEGKVSPCLISRPWGWNIPPAGKNSCLNYSMGWKTLGCNHWPVVMAALGCDGQTMSILLLPLLLLLLLLATSKFNASLSYTWQHGGQVRLT